MKRLFGAKEQLSPGHRLEWPRLHQAGNAEKLLELVRALSSHLARQRRCDVTVRLPVSLCHRQHSQTALTGRQSAETLLRPAPPLSTPVGSLARAAPALPCRPSPPAALRALPPVPARPLPAGLGGAVPAPRPPGAPSPARFPRVAAVLCCSLLPLSLPSRRASRRKRFFSVVGERKSASSKISEVQVHHIFLRAACYTLRESDCRAPGALLAVRGCSCFPLSQRQKQKWNLLTLSAVPSPVVVAVADLQALWINSKAGNKRSLLAAIISH